MMSKYDLSHTGTLSRASFYLPFNSANLNPHEFDKTYLSEFDYFPVISSLKVFNLDTALLFKKLNSTMPSIYFESNSGSNSYSIIATQTNCSCASLHNLEDLRNFVNSTRVPPLDFPFFTGGLIGFWSYDLGLKLLDLPEKSSPTIPKQYFFMPQEVIVYDKKAQILTIVVWANCKNINDFTLANIHQRLEDIKKLAISLENQDYALNITSTFNETNNFSVNISDGEFCTMIKRAQEYISKGEIFQIVLSRCWKKDSPAEPEDVFQRLRQVNPSPYMFFVKLPDLILIGASPETQVVVQDRNVLVSPIAGTRKICGNKTLDLKAAQELLTDEKELAEHIMLVDLSRNELSRVSKPGTVQVEEMFRLKYFSNVVHLVSTIKGTLRDNHDSLEAFKSCFPAGTLSGAPKNRAMEIISELEPMSRGAYGGAVGYIDFNGNIDSCIIIRTALYKDGEYIIQSGAGIVADSDPEKECLETFYKARALMTTIQAVEE
ncbi:MAG: anthranilate synthase component I family protein, partial [Syntrophomonadaceae bacterium]|nr:anthranilate synthase component I family protein [Syntrophomonadaceae bacterium]